MASSEEKENTLTERHCAFCLKLKPFKLCSGCRRRAYCSVECQKEDWRPLGKGQGHKNYCKIEHGQEDLDWEVKPVPGKGLGIIAKRPIPSMYRILIEGVHSSADSHPGIDDLSPEGGSLQEKFLKNSINSQHKNCLVVGLRYSRTNHSCSPNAALAYCATTDVYVLYACRDIEAGEEICRNYKYTDETQRPQGYLEAGYSESSSIEFELVAASCVLSMGGVTCPDDCICNHPSYYMNFSKLRNLLKDYERYKSTSPTRAMGLVDEILLVLDALHASWGTKCQFRLNAFDFAVDHPELSTIGLEHAKIANDILLTLCPLSKKCSEIKEAIQLLL